MDVIVVIVCVGSLLIVFSLKTKFFKYFLKFELVIIKKKD